MITVSILINQIPLFTRSASRVRGNDDEECEYMVDTGETINHRPEDGCIKLVEKMLKTIREK